VTAKCACGLCIPTDEPVHPKYGYSLARAKTVPCLTCGEIIGEEPYVEDLCWARFGEMMLRHARCESESAKKERLKMEKVWDEKRRKR